MNQAEGFSRIPVAEVFRLGDTVPYRDRQVLSRNVYRKGNDAVTVFSFAAGEGISQEVLDEDCLYWMLEGEAAMVSGDGGGAAQSGDGLVVPAGTPHAVDMTTRAKILALTVGPPMDKETEMSEELIKNIDKSKVVALRELVAVEKGQVSSLTLAQKDNLTVTVFAFDAQTGIGGHSSTGDAMVNVIDGEGQVTIGDAHYALKAGESIVMPAGIPHAVKAGAIPFKMLLIVVKP